MSYIPTKGTLRTGHMDVAPISWSPGPIKVTNSVAGQIKSSFELFCALGFAETAYLIFALASIWDGASGLDYLPKKICYYNIHFANYLLVA